MKTLDRIKSVVGTFAPGIAAALGGPVAGMATTAICEVFDIKPDAPDVEQQMNKALNNMTPEQAERLQRANNDFEARMKELGVDVFALVVKDKGSARTMYGRKGLENKIPQITLGLIIVSGTFWVIYHILSGKVPATVDSTLVGAILGYAVNELKNVSGFYFGSAVEGNGVERRRE